MQRTLVDRTLEVMVEASEVEGALAIDLAVRDHVRIDQHADVLVWDGGGGVAEAAVLQEVDVRQNACVTAVGDAADEVEFDLDLLDLIVADDAAHVAISGSLVQIESAQALSLVSAAAVWLNHGSW